MGNFIFINPVTASLSKYYEKTKSNYSRDIDHLVTFNKNGLWIKENLPNGSRIISAAKPEGKTLLDVSILHLDEDFNLIEKIKSKKANVQDYVWLLNDVSVVNLKNGNLKRIKLKNLRLNQYIITKKLTIYLKILIRCHS